MISTIIRREREHCCDDMVVGHTPEPLHYATALTVLASRKTSVPLSIVAASGQPTHLFNRIQRIMEMKKNPFSYSRMVATIIIVVIIGCSIAWIKPPFKAKKNKAATAASTKTPVEPKTIREDADAKKEEAAAPGKDKQATVSLAPTLDVKEVTAREIPEENLLVQRLIDDKLIDQVKGFVVEKQQNKLFINGELQTDDVAGKYLLGIKKAAMRMQVFSLQERIKQHPGSDFIQLILPFTFESPCVDKRPVKDGC
jgi:hypothetical protein